MKLSHNFKAIIIQMFQQETVNTWKKKKHSVEVLSKET